MDDVISKLQRLNMVFSRSATTIIPLGALCDELSSILDCNIYLFDPTGHIFAYSVAERFLCPYTEQSLVNRELPSYYMDLFNKSHKSFTDMYEEHPICTYEGVQNCLFGNRYYSMYPIFSMFKKVAGVLFIRYGTVFSEPDKILCEYTCAIVSIEMLRQEQEKVERLSRQAANAKLAVNSLTFSEKQACLAILQEIEWSSGEVFLNSIASNTFTTPSTVSGALKKLELATLIATKSRGVKGVYVEVLNKSLRSELEEFERKPHR